MPKTLLVMPNIVYRESIFQSVEEGEVLLNGAREGMKSLTPMIQDFLATVRNG